MLPVKRIADPSALVVPTRLTQLGSLLAWVSLALVVGGMGLWFALDRSSITTPGDRGPWPFVLGLAFVSGVLGAGCGVTALVLGGVPRRRAVGAVTISLVAPTLVGIVALALFFATTTFNWL